MININNIKTIPQSIDHLNSVILGMSETNQVIPKAYNSALPVQERLDGLEDQMVEVEEKSNDALADISELRGIVEGLATAEDTGWIELTVTNASIDESTYNVFIRKIGKVVTITGKFKTTGTVNPYPPTNLVASFPDSTYAPKTGITNLVGYYTLSGTREEITFEYFNTGNALNLIGGEGTPVPSGAWVFIPNITYITNH